MVKGERYTVYAGEPMQLALNGHDENRSGRLNTVCDRYLQIVAHESPEWPQAKWCAVCDALNGYWMTDEASIRFAWAEIDDCEGLGEKWNIDQESLAKEIREMSYAGRVALVETVERFWKHADRDTSDALRLAGANVSGSK